MKTINKFLTIFILLSLFLAGTPIQSAYAAGVRYAKPTVSGTGDCFSWANACTLQTALTGASSGDQIWVAAGTYTPHASDRTVSFVLKNGVAIYGGFAGTETLLSERNYAVNLTILSGDLNGDDVGFGNKLENSFHVVVGSGTNSTAVLDGVTVTGGKANGSFPLNVGGGMYNDSGSPTLTNATFSRNSAVYGAGLFNENNSSPTLTNVTFNGNQATTGGGGMYNWTNSNPTLTNVTFSGNLASGGGGMFNNNSSPADTDTNFTFSTSSVSDGGGMFNNNNSSPTLTNVIIANSLSGGDCVNGDGTLNAASSNNLIEDSANACGLTNGSGGNIIGQGPNLGPLTGSPAYFPLLSGSPAIDAGTNTGCPATDQRGVARPQGSRCDIGAYEGELEVLQQSTISTAPQDGWVLEKSAGGKTGGTVNRKAATLRIGDDAKNRQ